MLQHIPHQGRMCLWDEVLDWDEERLRCRSGTHRETDHPLRAHGRLGISCGIEYAAQAMAIHGALLCGAGGAPSEKAAAAASAVPAAGMLASLRGVRAHVLRLDDIAGDLVGGIARLAGDAGSALYEFDLRSGGVLLLSGRATVILDAGGRPPA